MAARSGHGRRSRPDTVTIAAGEPEVDDVGDGGRARPPPAACTSDQEVDQAARSRCRPASPRRPTAAAALQAQHALEGRCAAPARKLSSSSAEIRDRRRSPRRRAMQRGPDHQPADRIPFEAVRRAVGDRARQQREIAEPPGRQADADQEGDEEERRRRRPQARPRRPPPRPAPPSGSSRSPRSGSAAARDRTAATDSGEPDATDANSSAAAAPAPIPMRTICIITSCPARSSG